LHLGYAQIVGALVVGKGCAYYILHAGPQQMVTSTCP